MPKQTKQSKTKMPYQEVRQKVGKTTFTILTNPGAVAPYLDGKLPISKVLFADGIFTNVKKGIRATEKQLYSAFATSDPVKAAEAVLRRGKRQLSSSERKKSRDVSFRQFETYLISNYLDARTGLPIPATRIRQVRGNAVFNGDLGQQAKQFLALARGQLPLKRKEREMTISLPKKFKSVATAAIEKVCSVIERKTKGETTSWTLGCLPGELDQLNATLSKLTAKITESKKQRTDSKSPKSSRKAASKPNHRRPRSGGRRKK